MKHFLPVMSSGSHKLILAADDDADAQVLLRRAFHKVGVKADLRIVSHGVEVIRYLLGQADYGDRDAHPFPDLLIVDLKMPVLSGFEVVECIRKDPKLHQLPLAVLSASPDNSDIQRAAELGADYYLIKPNDFEALQEQVRGIALIAEKPDAGKPPNPPLPGIISLDKRMDLQSVKPGSTAPPGGGESHVPKDSLYKELVEQVRDYAIFVLDKTGRVVTWNEGARRLKGYEAHEIIGRHFSVFYPLQDRESGKPAFELRMVAETGRYEEEGWRVRKDGTRFWASVVVCALRNPAGQLTGFAKVTRDLTQKRLQEESFQKLLESEERFRLLVEQVKDYAIFMMDPQGHITSWNQGARRIEGYSSDEIIGKHFSIFYTPEDLLRDHPARELSLAIRDGRYEEEGWRVRKDGGRFWASVVITALWDKRGNLAGFAKVTRDLTDRKKEQEALLERTRDLEAFAHTLSHDLRSPIRSIASFAQILKTDKDLTPTERDEYLAKISGAARSMETLVNDLLKFSQASLAPGTPEVTPLRGILEEALALIEADVKNSQAQIHLPDNISHATQGSRSLLVQVFVNLIGNAIKFVAPGQRPEIRIEFESLGNICRVHVRDNGIGIPPQHQARIFNIFERLDNPASGHGLGLAIVKKAVERSGGRISVQSEPGRGSDFIVDLPCQELELAAN